MKGCKGQTQMRTIKDDYLQAQVQMNLPGENGQDIQLTYEDGYWTLTNQESSREIRRLQSENDRLQAENKDLERQLKKAVRLASSLQLDMQKLVQASNGVITFSNEEKRRQFLETTPENIVNQKLLHSMK